jgi:hypothetical protein
LLGAAKSAFDFEQGEGNRALQLMTGTPRFTLRSSLQLQKKLIR